MDMPLVYEMNGVRFTLEHDAEYQLFIPQPRGKSGFPFMEIHRAEDSHESGPCVRLRETIFAKGCEVSIDVRVEGKTADVIERADILNLMAMLYARLWVASGGDDPYDYDPHPDLIARMEQLAAIPIPELPEPPDGEKS